MAPLHHEYIVLTNFRTNLKGSGYFCVDMIWNDPISNILTLVETKTTGRQYNIQQKDSRAATSKLNAIL